METSAIHTAVIRAVARFEEGYASTLDLHDPLDLHAFAQLLADEVRDLLTAAESRGLDVASRALIAALAEDTESHHGR